MTRRRGAVIVQTVVFSAITAVVGLFVAAGVSHERRIDMLAKTMARSLAVQERAVEDIAENRQAMLILLEKVCRAEGEKTD